MTSARPERDGSGAGSNGVAAVAVGAVNDAAAAVGAAPTIAGGKDLVASVSTSATGCGTTGTSRVSTSRSPCRREARATLQDAADVAAISAADW